MQWRNLLASFIAMNDEHSLLKGKKQGELSYLKSDCQFQPQVLQLQRDCYYEKN